MSELTNIKNSIDSHSLYYYLVLIIVFGRGCIGTLSRARNRDAQSLCSHCELTSFLNYVLIDG